LLAALEARGVTRGCQELLESVIDQAGRASVPTLDIGAAISALGGGARGRTELARELGVARRTVERYTTTSGAQRRTPRGARAAGILQVAQRERQRAGIANLRQNGLTIAPGSEVQTCYDGGPQGPRDLSGFGIADNSAWLDAFERGDVDDACAEFNQTLFADYGADALELCEDEDQDVRINA
jgi:hypothetical protein